MTIVQNDAFREDSHDEENATDYDKVSHSAAKDRYIWSCSKVHLTTSTIKPNERVGDEKVAWLLGKIKIDKIETKKPN